METIVAGYTLGFVLAVSGWAIERIARAGKSGALSRNAIAGIRTPATMASDEAWKAAHRVAAGPTAAGAIICLASGVAAMFIATLSSVEAIPDALADPVLLATVIFSSIALLGLGGYGCFVGNRAPKAETKRRTSELTTES